MNFSVENTIKLIIALVQNIVAVADQKKQQCCKEIKMQQNKCIYVFAQIT